jgi:prepilin-type N-terminal cleavage/methylation domain-containing protein
MNLHSALPDSRSPAAGSSGWKSASRKLPVSGSPRGGLRKSGFTLIEVMLATMILAMGLGMILMGVSQCLGVAKAARVFDTTRNLLSQVEAENPIEIVEEIDEIEGHGDFEEAKYRGYSWKRTVEEEGDKKYGLFKITTTVTWSENEKESSESVVTYRYSEKEASKAIK